MKRGTLLILFTCRVLIGFTQYQTIDCPYGVNSYFYYSIGSAYDLSFQTSSSYDQSEDTVGYIDFTNGIHDRVILGDSIFDHRPDVIFFGKISRKTTIPILPLLYNLPVTRGLNNQMDTIKIKENVDQIGLFSLCASFSLTHPRNKKGNIPNVQFQYCSLGNLSFENDSMNQLRILKCNTETCSILGSVLNEVIISGGSCKSLIISDCKILQNPRLYFLNKLPDILLENCDLTALNGLIDLTNVKNDSGIVKSHLRLVGIDISKLRFNYADFDYYLEEKSIAEAETFYKQLKDQYAKLGMTESYKEADIDAQKFRYKEGTWYHYIVVTVNEWWWNFGYNKELIFRNSAILFGLFFFVNLFIGLPNLIFKGYGLKYFKDEFSKISGLKQPSFKEATRNVLRTFLFTGYIFWGINLDKKELNIKYLGYVFYLLFQYLVGLICLAYLANYIISK